MKQPHSHMPRPLRSKSPVHQGNTQNRSRTMPNALELKQRSVELQREVSSKLKAVDEGGITVAEFTQYMAKAKEEDKEIGEGIKAYNDARHITDGADRLP